MGQDAGTVPEGGRLIEPEDLKAWEVLSSPDLSPDGAGAVFARTRTDGAGVRIPECFEVSLYTGVTRRIPGPALQECPVYSPRGDRVAYLGRQSPKEEAQIWIWNRIGGEAVRLTRMRHGVSGFAWSPDGGQLAFSAPGWPGEEEALFFREMTAREREQWDFDREHLPMILDSPAQEGSEDGWVSRVCVADVNTGEARSLTGGGTPFFRPAWSADGKRLAYYGRVENGAGETQPALFLHDLAGDSLRRLETGEGLCDDSPALFTPQGDLLFKAWVGREGAERSAELFLLEPDGGRIFPLFPERERCHGVGSAAEGGTGGGSGNPAFRLGRDGQEIFFLSAYKGRETVCRLSLGRERRIRRVPGKTAVKAFCPPLGGRMLAVGAGRRSPDALLFLDLASGEARPLVQGNARLQEYALARPRPLKTRTRDGLFRLRGGVLMPPKLQPGQLCPALLYVHDGPGTFRSRGFWPEAQVIAARGIAVISCDPRGSAGHGRAFAPELFAWGREAVEDLKSFLDAALQAFPLDAGRLGVAGDGYGGYLALRLLAGSERFRAAAVRGALSNLAAVDSARVPGFLRGPEGGPVKLRSLSRRLEFSPIADADRMMTPLLILHEEEDRRFRAGQARQLYAALRDTNPQLPVRLLLYPGDGTRKSREDRPGIQAEQLREICRWFERFLKEDAAL